MTAGSCTWREISSQPDTWRAALAGFRETEQARRTFLHRLENRQIALIGCGSTHYLAQSAAACMSHACGVSTRALPSSELWMYPELVQPEASALIAISRSGTTTETLWATRRFREVGGGPILAITCHPDSPLAGLADFVLGIPSAQEQSIAQTRSFTSMFVVFLALTALFDQKEASLEHLLSLPGTLAKLIERMGDAPRQAGEDLSLGQIIYLGGGPLFGLASEAMLKTMEMSITPSQAFHPLEYRHGPMSLVGRDTLVVALMTDSGAPSEIRVLQDLKRLGARTLILAEDASRLEHLAPDYLIEIGSGMDEWERAPLYLPPLQHLAYRRALAKGLDPDRPRNLTAVVELQPDGSAA